nr:MAG TPA: hypothetical protein [Caudoviricetes sp.]
MPYSFPPKLLFKIIVQQFVTLFNKKDSFSAAFKSLYWGKNKSYCHTFASLIIPYLFI